MWQRRDQDGLTVLTCTADGDSADAVEEAFQQLQQAIAAEPRRRWVLDVGRISRISSLAIAQLIAAVRTVDLAGGRIVLVGAHPFVANVLRTTRIVKVLPLFDDHAAARAWLDGTEAG
ncbi:MAG: STAS domain-containing protein [Planctomycetota bacterium]